MIKVCSQSVDYQYFLYAASMVFRISSLKSFGPMTSHRSAWERTHARNTEGMETIRTRMEDSV